MLLKQSMKIGERIEVIKKHDYLDDVVGYSMVWDIIDEDEIAATLPMYASHPIALNSGDRVEIFFFRRYCSHRFLGEIVRRYTVGDASIVNIKQQSSIDRIQRRKFFRLKIVLPVTFSVLDNAIIDKESSTDKKVSIYKGYCMDISGGGLKLVTDHKLELNTIINCRIPLLDEEIIDTKGKVVRFLPLDGSALKYSYGIVFVDLDPQKQDRLIKFVFEEQRGLIRKDLD